jgi:serine/threonine-protein kinase
VATKIVDRQMALDVRAATAAEVVFYTLDVHGVPRVAATSLESSRDAAAALPPAEPNEPTGEPGARARSVSARRARTATIGGVPYALQGAALTTAGGEIVGGFVLARPVNAMSAQIVGVRRSILLAGALGLALALVAAWSSARHVTRPARALARAATYALDGDYDGAARIASGATSGAPPNEVAALGAALGALLEELREKQALGAVVARGAAAGAEVPADSEEELPPRRRPARYSGPGPRVRMPASVARPIAGRFPSRPSGALPSGAVVAERYEIHEVLGVGGTGIVYRATDRSLGDIVALKMLRAELVNDDPRAREELKHELRLTRRVSHRNIVRTYDFGSSGGVPFFTMEYVEGTSLDTVLAHRGSLAPAVVVALAKQLIRALEAAHEQGIMHGDLKPANLLVALDGLLKVSDFGVASLVRRPWPVRAVAGTFDDLEQTPQLVGAVVGTPEYMAPELLLGGRPDPRTDLYAAGMVLHECLTGATPFPRDTPRGFLARKLDASSQPSSIPPAPSRAWVRPPTLEALVAAMVAPDPADRPPSAFVVGEALARL